MKLITILITLLVFSCNPIPKYSRPNSPVPEMIATQEQDDEMPIAAIKWQEFFRNDDLKQIIQTTLENNRDLKIAVLNIDAARALYRVSRSELMPNLEANFSVSKQRIPSNAIPGNFNVIPTLYDANLASAFELDLFGRVRSENKAALETFYATREARNLVQSSLIAETASAYLQLIADREVLELAKQNLADQEKSFGLVKNKFKKGVISKYDLAAAEIAIENEKFNIADYENKVTKDKNALLLLMGVKNSDLLDKKTSIDDIVLLDDLLIDTKSEILLLRPDIMKAEHDLKSANANIGAARAAFFPRISLTGSTGLSSTELSNLFSGDSRAWKFSPAVNIPIFEVGRNKANLDYAKVIKDINVATYEKAIQNAFREVSDELSNKETIQKRLASKYRISKASEDAYNFSLSRYKAGIDSFIDVANLENQMFNAKRDYIALKQEKLANSIRIYKTFGGGTF